ncbi:MAG: AraC family transcriptional regulator [Xanthomonadales bacterium]|nr:AraC family transcriptional regulator [Xanthomonadales bacterium]
MDKNDKSNSAAAITPGESRPIPCERLDPAQMRPEDRYDAYYEASAEMSELIDQRENRKQGVEAQVWLLDDLVFLDARVCSHTMLRRKKHLRQSECDLLFLTYGPGTTHVLLEDQLAVLDAGALHLTDYARERIEHYDDEGHSCVLLPHNAIGYDPSRHRPHIRIDFKTPAGRLLATAWRVLHDQLPDVKVEDSGELARGFAGLVGGLLFPSEASEASAAAVAQARGEAMHHYIDRHLDDPQLGVDRLMQVFAASRATVYRYFADEGGVNDYIYRRRLERAFRELAKARPARGWVTQVALQLGFSSATHFTRRFKAHFGCLPGDVLGMAWDAGLPLSGSPGSSRSSDFSKVGRWVTRIRP